MKTASALSLKNLRNQLLYSPEDVRLKQLDRLETLIAEIKLDQVYPYDYICFRVTGFRPSSGLNETFQGRNLKIELAKILADLSELGPTPVEDVREKVYSIEEISRIHNVSVRTVFRWRKLGLVSRKYAFNGGRVRNGVRRSALLQFVKENRSRVERSGRFSKMTPYERKKVVDMARQLFEEERLSLNNVAERVAKHLGRSREAIRYTIRDYTAKHPDEELVPDKPGVEVDESKQAILEAYQTGTSVRELCGRFGKKRAAIYRTINQARAEALLNEEFDYIYSQEFDANGAADEILAESEDPANGKNKVGRAPKNRKDLPAYLRSLYGTPLLTKEEERRLFRQYNFLKYRICQLRADLDPKGYVPSRLLDEIDAFRDKALSTRNRIIQANLRLVVSVAKRHAGQSLSLFELISEGNVCLMRAVERFDYSRGNRFSTYATWALMKSFARAVPAENYIGSTFITGQQEMLDAVGLTPQPIPVEEEELQQRMRDRLGEVLDKLSQREREIIKYRYGLEKGQEPRTLAEVGSAFGVTRERIRQIEANALQKLKTLLEGDSSLNPMN